MFKKARVLLLLLALVLTLAPAQQAKAADYFTAFFDSGIGLPNDVPPQTVEAGSLLVEPPQPTYPAGDFLGWYSWYDEDTEDEYPGVFIGPWDFANNTLTTNLVLVAQWGAQVSFDSQGGSFEPPQSVFIYSYAEKPSDPTRPDFAFNYWSQDPEGAIPWEFSTEPVLGHMTLYAQWTADAQYFTVTFDSQSGSAVPSQNILAGGFASLPSEPIRTGYVFSGWYTYPSEGELWDFNTKPINQDTTLYASWTAKESIPDVPIVKPDIGTTAAIPATGDTFSPSSLLFLIVLSGAGIVLLRYKTLRSRNKK